MLPLGPTASPKVKDTTVNKLHILLNQFAPPCFFFSASNRKRLHFHKLNITSLLAKVNDLNSIITKQIIGEWV